MMIVTVSEPTVENSTTIRVFAFWVENANKENNTRIISLPPVTHERDAAPGVILGWHEIPGCVYFLEQPGRKRVIEEKLLVWAWRRLKR